MTEQKETLLMFGAKCARVIVSRESVGRLVQDALERLPSIVVNFSDLSEAKAIVRGPTGLRIPVRDC